MLTRLLGFSFAEGWMEWPELRRRANAGWGTLVPFASSISEE
jgi:hypothetical protein